MYPKSKTQLSKEDKDASKFIVQGSRSQYYGVLSREPRKARNIYPWLTDEMLNHQIMKLKKIQKQGVAVRALHANVRVDLQLISGLFSSTGNRPTGGRPTRSTTPQTRWDRLRLARCVRNSHTLGPRWGTNYLFRALRT
jgi:hypothetical protein